MTAPQRERTKPRKTSGVCPSCGSESVVSIARARWGSSRWRYACAACSARWSGKRQAKGDAGN